MSYSFGPQQTDGDGFHHFMRKLNDLRGTIRHESKDLTPIQTPHGSTFETAISDLNDAMIKWNECNETFDDSMKKQVETLHQALMEEHSTGDNTLNIIQQLQTTLEGAYARSIIYDRLSSAGAKVTRFRLASNREATREAAQRSLSELDSMCTDSELSAIPPNEPLGSSLCVQCRCTLFDVDNGVTLECDHFICSPCVEYLKLIRQSPNWTIQPSSFDLRCYTCPKCNDN